MADPVQQVYQALSSLNNAVITRLEKEVLIMATIADLVAADAALASEVASIKGAIDAVVAAYNAAISNPATHLAPEDQAALDAAVGDIQTQTANLTTEQGTIPNPNPPANP